MADEHTARPWKAEIDDLDDDHYRVIRSANGRPLAYIDKELSIHNQDDLARLFLHSPDLLEATRLVFFAMSESGSPNWDSRKWQRWREFIGPVLAQVWVSTR